MQIDMTAAEQGKPASVTCKIEQNEKFDGKATVKLLGLPPNVTAPDAQITAADQKVTFTWPPTPRARRASTLALLPGHGDEGRRADRSQRRPGRRAAHRPAPSAKEGADAASAGAAAQVAAAAPKPSRAAPEKLIALDKLRQEQAAQEAR